MKNNFNKKEYIPRLIDEKLNVYLKLFGAVYIEGPKWCGKTWAGLNVAKEVEYLSDKSTRDLARLDPNYILSDNYPILLDEWQIVPSIWDVVRHNCDKDHIKGKYILTGSTTLSKKDEEEEVFHSGAGRIGTIKMDPMSLYEAGFSSGNASIMDMYKHKLKGFKERKIEIDEIADYVVRGGWPENLKTESKYIDILPKSYIQVLLEEDINERKDNKRDSNKMRLLLKSLARNESTLVSNKTILKDIDDYSTDDEFIKTQNTFNDYYSTLNDLYLIANQEAYSINYRSSSRVGKSFKRHLVDPSIACALLNLNVEKLLKDFETFGLLFESLVERDLRIYANYLNGKLYHFRDNSSGDEVDAIIEFEDGEYGAFEIKLSSVGLEDGIKSLSKFNQNVKKKPKFMCVIVGKYDAITIDKDTGIYIVPITSLRP